MSHNVIAFCNQKGGVGKTTTTFHIVDAARRAGHRVLALDMDPQGNLSTVLSSGGSSPGDAGMADALSGRSAATLADVVAPSIWGGVDLVATDPNSESLAFVRDELILGGAGRERRLRDALELIAPSYELVVIDCPPSLDLLTINALVAARQALVVSQSALFSANGLARLRRTIDVVRRSYNPTLELMGAIINLHERNTIAGREQLAEIADCITIIGDPVPKRVVLKDSAEAQTSLLDWGTTDARNLASIYRRTSGLLMEGVGYGTP
ncbi:ParA family protein [Rhodococcus kroppenstedtii]|uniref:ParA family protein n=1 Tax=Rhodococcoides kroppenstedtii TaxID=293050 RepID=UPI00295423FC|nr:ParA family protein [Rhodococcus kroppenstedtii]MDV7198596.1 ParA family protein [Rhodococcus kroppenstedtii]